MELTGLEFELNVQTIFYSHFHANRWIQLRLLLKILHDEFLFFGDLGVVAIDDHVHIVAHTYHYTIIALELLLAPVELERVACVVRQGTWWL